MILKVIATLLFLTSVYIVCAIEVYEDVVMNEEKEELKIYKAAIEFVHQCRLKEVSLCLKEQALKYVNALPHEYDIGGGIKIKSNSRNAKTLEMINEQQLPDEYDAREAALDEILWERIADYLSSHIIEFRLPPDAIIEMKKTVEEGRGRGSGSGGGGGGGGSKKGGGNRMQSLIMLLQLKLAILGAIALKVIGLIAFKALLVGKVALTLSSILALKKLIESKHTSYEVIASSPHHGDYGHFDRSFVQDQVSHKGFEGAARNINN